MSKFFMSKSSIFDNEIYEQIYGISAESLLVPFTADASERVAIPSLF